MDPFTITDKVVDVLGVRSTHVETVVLLFQRKADDYVEVWNELN